MSLIKNATSNSSEIFWLVFFIVLSVATAIFLSGESFRGCAFIDLHLYIEAAKTIGTGGNPYAGSYSIPAEFGASTKLFYLYPPLVAVFIHHLLFWGQENLLRIWLFSSSIFLSSGIYFLNCVFTKGRSAHSPSLLVLLLALLIFPPTLDGITLGQVDTAIFFLLALSAWALATDRQITLGIAIAIAGAIKASPWILVLVLIRYRYYKAMYTFIIATIFLILFSCYSPRGGNVLVDYIHSFGPLSSGSTGWITTNNYSLARLINGIFRSLEIHQAIVIGDLILLILLARQLCLPVSFSLESKLSFFSSIICLMVLAPPVLWYHHILWLIVPIFIGIKMPPARFISTTIYWGILFLLTTSFFIDKYLQLNGTDDASQAMLGSSMVIVSILALFVSLNIKIPQHPDM